MHHKIRAIALIAIMLLLVSGLEGVELKPQYEINRTPDVVYVGTPYDVVSRMLELANPKKEDLIYDLGCGDGRMLILAAQKYGCQGIGYDIDPERVSTSRENVKKNQVEHLVKIIEADIFTLDLSAANVISLYLLPEMNQRLLPQLEKLKPGSRLIFHAYDLEGIKADQTISVSSNEDNASHNIYLYSIPLKYEKDEEKFADAE